ncbi:MAG: hypothetical protein GY796_20330 [Chloroflexi bacterium]|nr:hypothetical protein [Chloroflexota bacterium]
MSHIDLLSSNIEERDGRMNSEEYANDALAQMFLMAQAQFGNAIKSFWFNDSDFCPSCGRKVDLMQVKGGEAMSLNHFIYRKKGVLIGYFLCGRCARKVFRDAKRNPGVETSLHAAVEENLIEAYYHHMNSMDA